MENNRVCFKSTFNDKERAVIDQPSVVLQLSKMNRLVAHRESEGGEDDGREAEEDFADAAVARRDAGDNSGASWLHRPGSARTRRGRGAGASGSSSGGRAAVGGDVCRVPGGCVFGKKNHFCSPPHEQNLKYTCFLLYRTLSRW